MEGNSGGRFDYEMRGMNYVYSDKYRSILLVRTWVFSLQVSSAGVPLTVWIRMPSVGRGEHEQQAEEKKRIE